jgi:hypothetical protein
MRMRASGAVVREIAAELGVDETTVRSYLRAGLCSCGENFVVKGDRCQACGHADRPVALPWTRVVLRAIREWAELEGCAPGFADWQSGRRGRGRWCAEYPRWPTSAVACRLFGSWNAAIEAAGFEVRFSTFTDEEVLAALRADAAERGRVPFAREWEQRPRSVRGWGGDQSFRLLE